MNVNKDQREYRQDLEATDSIEAKAQATALFRTQYPDDKVVYRIAMEHEYLDE